MLNYILACFHNNYQAKIPKWQKKEPKWHSFGKNHDLDSNVFRQWAS